MSEPARPIALPRTTGRTLVLGGARSGKSAFAEGLLEGADAVEYVATAGLRPDDAEWQARVDAHRRRRPPDWATTETSDVAGVLAASGGPVLIDSLTAWLTAELDECGAWTDAPGWRARLDAAVDAVLAAWASSSRPAIAVSDEVGGGVVPETASGRRFRDELGQLNQRVAAGADAVWLLTAGLPQRLK